MTLDKDNVKICTKFRLDPVEDRITEFMNFALVPDDHVFGLEETEDGRFLHVEGSLEVRYVD